MLTLKFSASLSFDIYKYSGLSIKLNKAGLIFLILWNYYYIRMKYY